MIRTQIFILALLSLSTNLSAQVVYDTIPEEPKELKVLITEFYFSFPVFEDIDSQLFSSLHEIDFKSKRYSSGEIVVSTVFGKDGNLKETKILEALNPYCDSIAFYTITQLKDWMPAMGRAEFVDYQLKFHVNFPNVETDGFSIGRYSYLNSSQSEFQKRKSYFDFYYSTDKNQRILNDFEYLKDYIAEELSDSTYIHLSEFDKPKRRNRAKVEITNNTDSKIPFLIRDPEKKWLLFYTKPIKTLYLEKGKEYQIIGFQPVKQDEAILSIDGVEFENDTLFTPDFRYSTKSELLKEINEF